METLRNVMPDFLIDFVERSLLNTTSCFVFFLVAFVLWRLLNMPRYPPGPMALPIIGHYKLLADPKVHEACARLSEKYGPVVTVQFGPLKSVILNNFDTVMEALITRRTDFAGRPPMPSAMALTEGGKDILMAQYTPGLKVYRKIVSAALGKYIKGPYLQITIDKTMGKCLKLFEETKGKPFSPHGYISMAVYNLICGVVFQKVYEFDDPKFRHALDVSNQLVEEYGMGVIEDLYPILGKFWHSQRYRKVVKLSGELLHYINVDLEAHKQDFDAGNIRDFTDCLLLAQKEAEDEGDEDIRSQLTDVHLRQTLSDTYQGAFDTIRFTMQWAILYMADNQEVQKKVQTELDRVVGRDRLPQVNDRPNLPFTEATLYEVMRIASVAPLGMPHMALVDSPVGGYVIPKGTTVMINHWALHNDPRYWPEPSKLDPGRFLNSDGSLVKKPKSWLPFSAGVRVCLGESTAKPELVTILAMILHQFNIKLPPGTDADYSPEASGFIAYTPNKYKVLAEKRV